MNVIARREASGLVRRAFAAGLKPDPVVKVSQWAQTHRRVAPEASAYPGPWDNALTPYLVEIMDCCSLADPCNDVVVKKSVQLGVSEAAINLFGSIVDATPAAMMIMLPTGDAVRDYVKTKLDPAIQATPRLRAKVLPQKSRDENGSTGTFKRFPGGFAVITGANSAARLQMLSIRVLDMEDVSEYPFDVDEKGDPVDQALQRTKSVTDIRKVLWNSTPDLKGSCRITIRYEASDQRRYYLPCPHCGAYQILKIENLRYASATPPHGAYFQCVANGCVIEAHHRKGMLARGFWLKTYPGEDAPGDVVAPEEIERYRARPSAGRCPGFAIWQAYSPFVSWEYTCGEWIEAQKSPLKLKTFTKRVLGEPFEEKGEVPDYEKLIARRESFPLATMPPGCLFLTGAADVQGNRIEWAVWGWGIGKTSWLIDKGIVEGDTAQLATFAPLTEIVARQYPNALGARWPIEAFAIDTGFNTQTVYAWARARGPRLLAIKGVDGHLRPPLGTPAPQEVSFDGRKLKQGILLWPVGQWGIKADFYAALRNTIEGPKEGIFPAGYVHLPDAVDEAYLKQLTAESLVKRQVGWREVQEWVKPHGVANEALDIRVYATAAAVHVGIERLTPEDWLKLAAERGSEPEKAQRELALWTSSLAPAAPESSEHRSLEPQPAPPPAASATGRDWLGERGGWIEGERPWL